MKTFAQVWLQDDDSPEGNYECREHDKIDCPYCQDIYIEKPLTWTITKTPIDISKKSLLDEVMEKNLRKFLNE